MTGIANKPSGSPTAWDRHLRTRFGISVVEQVGENLGVMVVLTPPGTTPVKLVDAVVRIRTVPPDGKIVGAGRALGIIFGGGTYPPPFQAALQ